MSKRLSILQRVANHLKKHGSLSQYHAVYIGLDGVKTWRLGASICVLRQSGWVIDTKIERSELYDGRKIIETNYVLVKAGL